MVGASKALCVVARWAFFINCSPWILCQKFKLKGMLKDYFFINGEIAFRLPQGMSVVLTFNGSRGLLKVFVSNQSDGVK